MNVSIIKIRPRRRFVKDIEESGGGEPVILNREKYRSAVRLFGGFHDAVRKGGHVFSEERRDVARVRIRKYWEDVKSGIRTRKNQNKDCYTWSIVGPYERKKKSDHGLPDNWLQTGVFKIKNSTLGY